jgi:hypothetical protein
MIRCVKIKIEKKRKKNSNFLWIEYITARGMKSSAPLHPVISLESFGFAILAIISISSPC